MPMQTRSTTYRFLLPMMIFIALAVSVSFQGSRGLYETSEGRYAECAREMLESGNWIEPTLNYAPHWTKPPLTYWAIALGINWMGHNEWGARSMNAIAFFLTTLAVTWIGRTLWDHRTGAIAGIVYATSLFPAAGAFALTSDTLLTFWEIFTVLCFLKACHSETSRSRGLWIHTMYVSLGFGFLTKGPPSLIPLIPILLWYLRTRKPAGLFRPSALFLFLVTGFSWYLLVCFRNPGLFSYFLGTEIVGRIVSDSIRNAKWYGPITVYLPVVLLGGGVWSFHGFKLLLKKKFLSPKVFMKTLGNEKYAFFLVSWLVPALMIFILVRNRLPLYILPLYAPFTLLVARGLGVESEKQGSMRKMMWTGILSAALLVGLKGASAVSTPKNDMKALYRLYTQKAPGINEVAAFNESRLFGLQYYLNGRLERISISGEEPWADSTVEEAVHALDRMPPGTQRAIIAKKRNSEPLSRILKHSDIAYRQFEDKHWIIYILTKGSDHPL